MAIASTAIPRRRNPNGLGTVYALADPPTGRIRYVGKTLTVPRDRLKRHLSDAARGSKWRVSNWLRSLSAEPRLIVLEECKPDLLGEAENDWIAYYRSLGANLTNLTDGGGSLGFTLSAGTRAKIGAAHRGKVVSPETRAKQRAAKLGRPLSAEHRAKVGDAQRGRKDPPDVIERKRLAQQRAFQDPARRAQLQAALRARWDKQKEQSNGYCID